MKQLLKQLKVSLIAATMLAGTLLLPTLAHADTAGDIKSGVGTASGCTQAEIDAGTCNSGAGDSVSTILTNVINIFSLVIGVIAVIVIIIAGLNYITSGGDSAKVSSAKSTILYAVIGLIVVAFAQLIVHFAIHAGNTNSTVPIESGGSSGGGGGGRCDPSCH